MPKPRHPFDIALLTISLAIGIPLVLLMFGALRTRQLQSKANPRWAQFAQTSAPQATLFSESTDSRSVIRTASIRTASPQEHDTERRTSFESNLTDSISANSSNDEHVQSGEDERPIADPIVNPEEYEPVVTAPIIFRAVDDDNAIKTAHATERFESLLEEIRLRLDQIALRQLEHHADDTVRESQFLESMTRLMESAAAKTTVPTHVPVPAREVTPDSDPARESEFDEPVRERTEPAKIRRQDEQPLVDQSDADSLTKPGPTKPTRPTAPSDRDRNPDHSPADPVPVGSNNALESAPDRQPQERTTAQPELVFPNETMSAPESIQIERIPGPDGTDLFTMDIRDADICEFFHKLSESTRISILPSPGVQGRISLNLHQVRLEAAFNSIIKSRGYVCEREDDIVIVSTREESGRLKDEHRTLVMKIYQPVHMEAAELNQLIQPLLSADGRHSVTSSNDQQHVPQIIVSERQTPAPRDAVIVQDVADVHRQIEQILVDLDVAPLQVEIEARILSVRLVGRFQHGVDLCQLPCQPETTEPLAVGSLKLGRISCQVPSFIRALEQVADARVVTSQRIQVLNKHKAEMLIGDRIADPSQPTGSALAAGTRLVFCPSISMDGSIRMEIHPERSSATLIKRGTTIHQTTAELTTHVLVRDGATVAVGGLVLEQPIHKPSRLPLMNAIPAMGSSLRHRREGFERIELMILVTPRIISDSDSSCIGQAMQQVSIPATTTFRDRQSGMNQHQMARAHYNRAFGYFQQGNYIKARQQIDVSLCGNRSDAEAVKLRNQIATCLSQRATR